VARWANAHPEIWKARPVRGDIGIVFVPESQLFNYVQQGSTAHYAQSARGAYQAFFDSGIQADFVHVDHMQEYPAVYLPYPVMLKEETARKLIGYVEGGGQLISEGLPGYFGDRGKAGTVQPNLGLDRLFGARESYVEFAPDLLDDLTLTVRGKSVYGRYFLQEYSPAGGKAVGNYGNGHVAAVENRSGRGKALLVGTYPGAGYFKHHSREAREFFRDLLEWAGIEQQVESGDAEVKARLHTGPGGSYLWVVNPTRTARAVTVTLSAKSGAFSAAEELWQQEQPNFKGRSVEMKVSDRNVAVVRLK
jgi:beta-galactosidase